jgi:predicted nucleotidyltransferase
VRRPPPLPDAVAALAGELAALPGAVAVALGGSRATGTARPDSDWDLGVYYRASRRALDPADVRALGHEGHVSELGEWGPVVHGGAWLTVGGLPVDVLFRDLDRVEAAMVDASRGAFAIVAQNGHVAGAPTYLPVGELALCRPLAGELPRPTFGRRLGRAARERWAGQARVALMFALGHARGGDPVGCAGALAVACLSAAHGRMAAVRTWVLGEKRLVRRAGLEAVEPLLAVPGATADELTATVRAVGEALGLDALSPR